MSDDNATNHVAGLCGLGRDIARLRADLERVTRERDTWKRLCETCCDIEKRIAEHLGIEAWTTADGEVLANVVESRLPELVEKLKRERDALAAALMVAQGYFTHEQKTYGHPPSVENAASIVAAHDAEKDRQIAELKASLEGFRCHGCAAHDLELGAKVAGLEASRARMSNALKGVLLLLEGEEKDERGVIETLSSSLADFTDADGWLLHRDRALLAPLVEALELYGHHNPPCPKWDGDTPCTCGFDAALAAAKELIR